MGNRRIGVLIFLALLYFGANAEEEGEANGEKIPEVSPTPPAASPSEEETKEPLTLNPVESLDEGTGSEKEAVPGDEAAPETEADPGEETAPETEAVSEKEIDSGMDGPEEVETLPLQVRRKLSYQRLTPPLLPEDFKIGSLGGGSEQEPILIPVRGLLNGLKEGTTDETLLVPELKTSLARILEDFPPGDLTYRLGKVNFLAEGYSSVNCRLYRLLEGGEQAVASGEFHLEHYEGNWLIAAVDVDFEELLRPYLREEGLFEPQSYRWLELY